MRPPSQSHGGAVNFFIVEILHCYVTGRCFRFLFGLRLIRGAMLEGPQLSCYVHGNRTILTNNVRTNVQSMGRGDTKVSGFFLSDGCMALCLHSPGGRPSVSEIRRFLEHPRPNSIEMFKSQILHDGSLPMAR